MYFAEGSLIIDLGHGRQEKFSVFHFSITFFEEIKDSKLALVAKEINLEKK